MYRMTISNIQQGVDRWIVLVLEIGSSGLVI